MMKKIMVVIIMALLAVFSMAVITLAADDLYDVTMEVSPANAKPGDTVTVSGTVRDKATNAPVSGVAVPVKIVDGNSIVSLDYSNTDASGRFSVKIIIPDTASGDVVIVGGIGSSVENETININNSNPRDPADPDPGTPSDPSPTNPPGGGGGGGGTTTPTPTPNTSGGTTTTTPNAVDTTSPVTTTQDPTKQMFPDVPPTHWAFAIINQMCINGFINGYPDGNFKPSNTITRAEFATIIVKAYGLTVTAGKTFDDTTTHWAKDTISTAYAAGIVGGYSESKFGPNDPITREQMSAMIIKAANIVTSENEPTFKDSNQVSAWARQAVAIATGNKLMNGYPDNTFKPKGNATRAEAVTVISNARNHS